MTGRRGRSIGIAAASVTLHAALIAVIATYAPRLIMPDVASGPPEPIIPVLIMPRTPPAATGPSAKPTPIRLHRRPQRFLPPETEVPPLVIPEAPAVRPSAPTVARPTALPASRDVVADNVARTLKGRLGCANPSLLSRAEREACEDKLAAGARDAAFAGLGIARDKARSLAAAAERRQADYNFKRGITPPAPPVEGAGWDKSRGPPGQAEALAAALKNDRPKASLPF
jgi:hypothetical protein